MHAIERRAFVRGAAVGALAFSISGVEILLTPGAARAQGVPLRTLTTAQAQALEAVGPKPLHRRPRHLCHQRRLQSDLYDLRPIVARGRATGLRLEYNRRVTTGSRSGGAVTEWAILGGEDTCLQFPDCCAWPPRLWRLPR
jgi:hypothetical protein